MLASCFVEVSLGSMLALQLFLAWSVHFVYFRQSRSRYLNFKDRALASSRLLASQEQPQSFCKLILFSSLMSLFFLLALSTEAGPLYFRHLSVEEGGLALLFLAYLSVALLSVALAYGSGQRRSGGSGPDFFTSVWLIAIVSPLAFLASNLVCFFLVLEAISASSMYMLVSSRGSFSGSVSGLRSSRQLVSTLFFHFWSSFFSSVLLVFSIISFLLAFGTTEWAYLDSLLSLSVSLGSGPSSLQVYSAAYALVLAALIKLGASPFFFFKLEVYKGLPLLPLVFYSVFYFFAFNLVFFSLLAYQVPALLSLVSPGLGLGLVFSVFFLGASLFSLPLLRSFFALSSVIGSTLVLFLLLCFFF